MKIYNSLTKQVEIFKGVKNNEISMYVCGPTVYDRIHIGNARNCIVFDFIYRFLKEKFSDKEIKYIRNITDVDDKIINRAKELGISERELSEEMIKNFHEDLEYLNCLTPTKEPKVTEEISECIKVIEEIIRNGYGYEKDGNVLFSVAKYQEYGKLSGREIENNINLTREIKNIEKENANDFILWKKTDIGITWDSPWGKGRPGWHIECSAMSGKYLGEDFDIHGGGMDLKFPHHENEIAQSKCANLGSNYAKYWIHNGMLTVNGEKMSKSLGNFITIADLRKKEINPYVIRMAILSAHYRNPLDFSEKLIYDWEVRLREIISYLKQVKNPPDLLLEEINNPPLLRGGEGGVLSKTLGEILVCSEEMKKRAKELRKDQTKYERKLWQKINCKQLGMKFRRQVPLFDRYIVDFVCFEERLIIEIDGSQHAKSKTDIERDNFLKQRGFDTIRFWNSDIFENLDGCLEVIKNYYKTPPSLPLEGEEYSAIPFFPPILGVGEGGVLSKILSFIENDFSSNNLINNFNDWIRNNNFEKVLHSLRLLGVDIEKYLEFERKKAEKIQKEPNYLKALNLAEERIKIKSQKNFQKADEIRKKIENLGFKIEDLSNGEFKILKIK